MLISSEALSPTLLELKLNELIDLIRSTGPWLLTAHLTGVRFSTAGNQWISGLGTNILARMSPDSLPSVSLVANRFQMKSSTICSCLPTTQCLAPAAIYHSPMNETTDIYDMSMNNTPIKGMQVACTPLEGVLSSTLECYFDPSCIQLLVTNASIVKPFEFNTANSIPTKYYY